MELYFATQNANKVVEIQKIVPEAFEVKSIKELGVIDDIPETSGTIAGNSHQKATYIFDRFNVPVFADDTGLEVYALNGAPGVHSARYAGEQKNNDDNINLLLRNLEDKENRSARFLTVITYIDSEGVSHQFEGTVEGEIVDSRTGKEGFGYDPVFRPAGFSLTFAEMSLEEKNKISHRGRAFRSFINFLSSQK